MDRPGRYEENLYLKRLMETAGHTETPLFEIQGFGHIEMHNPGIQLLIKELIELVKK